MTLETLGCQGHTWKLDLKFVVELGVDIDL